MNEELRGIPDRILVLATGALAQANTHAAFMDPDREHWPQMSVLNAAHAGELFLKAIIAAEHPLLIFKDLPILDDKQTEELNLQTLLARGRTHDFEKLPQVSWATAGIRIPNVDCYERLRRARNAIQHFCEPDESNLSGLSLEFIYSIIDPLIHKQFELHAIEFHEDYSVGYDHLVGTLLRREIRFSMPSDFHLEEIRIFEEISQAGEPYRAWLEAALAGIGKEDLLRR